MFIIRTDKTGTCTYIGLLFLSVILQINIGKYIYIIIIIIMLFIFNGHVLNS